MVSTQEWITAGEAAKRLGISVQRLNQLVVQGIASKKLTSGKFPWPRIQQQYEEYKLTRPDKITYTGGNIDMELSQALSNMPHAEVEGESPGTDDIPVMDRKSQPQVDKKDLDIGEQIIMAIQNRIKGAEAASYQWARSLNENIKARDAMLELRKKEGTVLERDEVEKWLYNTSRHNRDLWMAWPQTVATEIAEKLGCDSHLLYAALMDEVRKQLTSLATIPGTYKEDVDDPDEIALAMSKEEEDAG